MPITVEDLGTTPPQVGVTVTDLDSGSASTIRVERSWDGGWSWHAVRGADGVSVTGAAFFRDHAPPLNVEAKYRVTVLDGGGVISRENLVPNPSFETGTGSVSAIRASVATASSPASSALFGDDFLVVTIDPSPTWGATVDQDLAAIPGEGDWIAVRIPVLQSTATATTQYARAEVTPFVGGSGTVVPGSWSEATVGAYQVLTVTAQIPAGTTSVDVGARIAGAQSVSAPPEPGAVFHSDAWVTATGSTEAEALAQLDVGGQRPYGLNYRYFDGDTPATGTYTYEWSGTAHASSSIQRAIVVESEPITVTSDYAWIMDPLAPTGAVRVRLRPPYTSGEPWLALGSITESTQGQNADLATPQGATRPVASVGQRQTSTQVPIRLSYDQATHDGSLPRLFKEAGQLAIIGLPDSILDAVAHVVLPDLKQIRQGNGEHQLTTWEATAITTRPQGLALLVPYYTYADVQGFIEEALGSGATYQDVLDATPGATYLDWLRDPKGVLGL